MQELDFPRGSVDRYKIMPKRMEPYTPVRHIPTRIDVAQIFYGAFRVTQV